MVAAARQSPIQRYHTLIMKNPGYILTQLDQSRKALSEANEVGADKFFEGEQPQLRIRRLSQRSHLIKMHTSKDLKILIIQLDETAKNE